MNEPLFNDDAWVSARGSSVPESAGVRLTKRNKAFLEAKVHPATRRALLPGDMTCGDCAHHTRYEWHQRSYHKCDLHRLGESHSEASDIRISWPACALFEP